MRRLALAVAVAVAVAIFIFVRATTQGAGQHAPRRPTSTVLRTTDAELPGAQQDLPRHSDVPDIVTLTVRVLVCDDAGSAIEGATATLRYYGQPAPAPPVSALTDDTGAALLHPSQPAVYVLAAQAAGYISHEELVSISGAADFTVTLDTGPRLILHAPPSPGTLPAAVRILQPGPPTITRELPSPVPPSNTDAGVWRSGLTEIWYPGVIGQPDMLAVRIALPEDGSVDYVLPPVHECAQTVRVISAGNVIANWDADAANARAGMTAAWRHLVIRAVDGDAGTYALTLGPGENMLRIRAPGYGTALVPLGQPADPLVVSLDLETIAHVQLSAPSTTRVAVAVRRTRDPVSGRELNFSNPTLIGGCGDGPCKHMINLSAHDCTPAPVAVICTANTTEDTFTIPGLPAESSLLLVAQNDEGACAWQVLPTAAPRSVVDVRLTWPDVNRTTLAVVDAAGRAMTGAVVRLFDPLGREDLGAAVTDESGQLVVLGLDETRRYRLGIQSPRGYEETWLPDRPPDEAARRIVLAQAAHDVVRCRVIDNAGTPVPSVPVSFCIIGGVTITSMTDPSGVAVAPVPRGVNASAVVYGKGSADPVVKRLVDGEAVLTMPMPLEPVLMFLNTPQAAGIDVRLQIRDREGKTTCDLSAYAFDGAPLNVNLAAGTYTVVLEWGGQRRETQLDVAGGTPTTVHIDLR